MSGAYYNEIDPYAAEWLRRLILLGHIAEGEVDERSIVDVHPSDLRGFTQCHFFAGIGVWSYALRRAGWPDERALWTGSCPCQPFSAAGKGGGFDDERHLWPAFHHLISECRPDVVVGEQVASKDGLAWIDLVQADLEGTGYASGAVDFCSASVGAPHIRQRLYWAGKRLANADQQQHGRGFGGAAGRLERADSGAVGGLDDDDARSQGHAGYGHARGGRALAPRSAPEASVSGGLADTDNDGRGAGQRYDTPARHGHSAAAARGNGGVEHASSERRERRQAPAPRHDPDGAASERPQGEHGFGVAGAHRFHRYVPGPTNGFWGAADWLFCRDGKWRPVEPGTFPLAHGAPARVGRLRAYGNGLCAPAAEAFVSSVRENLDAH